MTTPEDEVWSVSNVNAPLVDVVDRDFEPVVVDVLGETRAIRRSRAAFIAAAPAMLRALKAVMEQDSCAADGVLNGWARKQVREAIAAAEARK